MSGMRLLVGTRKDGFVLTADGKGDRRNVCGSYLAGWEIYHCEQVLSREPPGRSAPRGRCLRGCWWWARCPVARPCLMPAL
jgi:hypothetical protein